MRRRLSLPAEHGGYLIAVAAAAAATLIAPLPTKALAIGLVVFVAFLARGVLDRVAAGVRLAAWDVPWLGLLALAEFAALATLSPRDAALTGGLGVAIIGGSLLARRWRKQRDARFEAVAMGVLGASSGWAVLAAGGPLRDALGVAVVLAAHATLAVPLVRTQLRRRERAEAARAAELATAGLGVALAAVVALGLPAAALALLPRGLQTFAHAVRAAHPVEARPARAALVGLLETVALAATVAILVVTV